MGAGIELARAFHAECVGPIVASVLPRERYAAALLGPGSEVLGLDDGRSTDHDYGPRLVVLLADDLPADARTRVSTALDARLPESFAGLPVRYRLSHDPAVRHRVEVAARSEWFRAQAGFDPLAEVSMADWIAVPGYRLAELVAGAVYADGDGRLAASRSRLAQYPDDVWRWVLASQWQRLAEETPFAGRCAERGDLLGAAVIVARLARDVMRFWLLAARQHPPYPKWLGTVFARRPDTSGVAADLHAALTSREWAGQERHLGRALVATARRQNELGLVAERDPTLRPFHDRPFLVVDADGFAAALRASIGDPRLRALPLTGVCDQFADSVALLGSRPALIAAARALTS